MRLSELAGLLDDARVLGAGDPEITGLAYDSRRVRPGDLFFCVRGFAVDGLQFLPAAVEAGAVAGVVEGDRLPVKAPALRVESVRAAMPAIAAAFHAYPSRELALVGVTGTNGKTTITYLIHSLCSHAGWRAGVIGTLGCLIGDRRLPGERTTPEAPDLQALLRQMSDAGVRAAAMEVSSHALSLDRTRCCEFDVGVLSNITQDHLDFHGDMDAYAAAKAMLFERYPAESDKSFTAVLNVDDPFGRRLAGTSMGHVVTYGVENHADWRARNVTATATTLQFDLTHPEGEDHIRLRLGGRFNVHNALAAAAAVRALGVEWPTIRAGLVTAPGVPGRFEVIDEGQDFALIVDYAHTPDGLRNLLLAARELEPSRLTVVFGCGGDRDRSKRPQMGRLAADLADRTLITSDNPRSEDPLAILEEILAGVPAGRRDQVQCEVDRRTAIRQAIHSAEPGELVLIAGKGHEDYQIIGDQTIHFDDREEAREALRARLSA